MLSKNSNITWDIIKSNPHPNDKEWDYKYLSVNPNITWNIFQSSSNDSKKWSYNSLFRVINFFNNSYVEKIKNIISHFKTNITEELIMYVWHPSRVEKWKYLVDDIEK